MKFKIDENLPAECAAILREEGFDADTVGDEDLSGCSDPTVFGVCQHESRVLVTLDLDFSNVTAYPPSTHCGIVVIRSKAQDKLTLFDWRKEMAYAALGSCFSHRCMDGAWCAHFNRRNSLLVERRD